MENFLILKNFNPDWEELRQQKYALIDAIELCQLNPIGIEFEKLIGILHLIDYIQDQGVASGIWSEKEIFNLED